MDNKNKRLFFAFETLAPWKKGLPNGRFVNESDRHLTILFLGNINWPGLEKILSSLPPPPIQVGLTGLFDRLLYLPPKRPNVVAFHAKWTYTPFDFNLYRLMLARWIIESGLPVQLPQNEFLPHVTVCRRPFSRAEWDNQFTPLPFYISNFHLYESYPGLKYRPVYTVPILPPFDSTYAYGESKEQLAIHRSFAREHSLQFSSLPKTESPLPASILKTFL